MHCFRRAAIFALITVLLCHILGFGMKQQRGYMELLSLLDSETGHTTPMLSHKYPTAHHAIVIPYRERLENARVFISFMGSYLTRNFPNETFSVYFVVQVDSGLFSRGFLLNAGLNEIKRTRPETQCVILHDIDLLPMVDGVPYDDCTYPIQLSSEMERFKWGVPYDYYCGGIVNLHINDWMKVNGMSNDFEGWGGEDDDLHLRLQQTGLLYGPKQKIPLRPPKGKGRFSNHENASSISNENKKKQKHANYASNLAIRQEMRSGSHRWQTDGWNDVGYVLVDHFELVSKGTAGGNGFDEVHIIKVTGQANCLGTNISVHVPCIKGLSNKGPSSLLLRR
jgi:N-terminal domain of galactosyltransferase/N-terminal region of glycosyl transferase group 7